MKTDLVNIAVDHQIGAAPDLVYAVAADLPAWPQFIRGIDKLEILTDGPIAAGSRFRETRRLFGRSMIAEFTVAIFNPPRRLELCWDNYHARLVSTAEFLPTPGGTRLLRLCRVIPLSFTAQMLGVLISLSASSIRAQMQNDFEDIEAEVARRSKAKMPHAAPSS